jgi:photosystem II stability/assembly factor-like uncharacterized protein
MKLKITILILLTMCTQAFAQWTVSSSTTNLFEVNDINFTSTTTGYIVGTNAIPSGNAMICKTTNGGSSWSTIYSLSPVVIPSSLTMMDIEFASSQVGFAVGGYLSMDDKPGIICKTTNGGSSWDTLSHGLTDYRFYATCFMDVNNGFLLGDSIYKTTDGGNIWKGMTAPNSSSGYRKIQFLGSSVGYAIGNYTTLLVKTTDGGNNWSDVTLPTSERTLNMFFINQDTGFVSCENGVLLKTNDGGTSWNQVTVPNVNGSDIQAVYFVSSSVGFLGTYDSEIFKSFDGGNSWEINYDLGTSPYLFMGCAVRAFDFPSANIGYVGGLAYLIGKTTNGGGTSNIFELSEDLGIEVYPNPAQDVVYIKTKKEVSGTLNVSNVNGEILISKEITGDDMIDVSTMSVGVYFMEFTVNNKRYVKRIIKK